MIQFYDPMPNVWYIDHEDGGRTPEPPLDPSWPKIDKLRWLAALVTAETGLRIRFNDGAKSNGPGYELAWPELIGCWIGCTSRSGTYEDLWRTLTDVGLGVREYRRMLGREQ